MVRGSLEHDVQQNDILIKPSQLYTRGGALDLELSTYSEPRLTQ